MWKKILLLTVLIGALFLVGCTDSNGSGEYDDLAKWLTKEGVTMYGTEWCSHCQNQKEEFGSSFQYIDYVDCDRSQEVCSAAGVRGYPTWKINGELYPGEQSLDQLARLTGYVSKEV